MARNDTKWHDKNINRIQWGIFFFMNGNSPFWQPAFFFSFFSIKLNWLTAIIAAFSLEFLAMYVHVWRTISKRRKYGNMGIWIITKRQRILIFLEGKKKNHIPWCAHCIHMYSLFHTTLSVNIYSNMHRIKMKAITLNLHTNERILYFLFSSNFHWETNP